MNDIYESKIVVNTKIHQANNLVSLFIEELEMIPSRLLKFCFNKGLKIYLTVPNDKLFFVNNNLTLEYFNRNTADGRNYSNISHVLGGYIHNKTEETSIIFIGNENKFIKNGYPHSIIIHEFAHVVDYILGCHPLYWHDYDHYSFLSIKNLPKGEPLDWYAAKNIFEKFAVAFESFYHSERFRSKCYATNNKLKLFNKAPEIFKFFEQFFKNWK